MAGAAVAGWLLRFVAWDAPVTLAPAACCIGASIGILAKRTQLGLLIGLWASIAYGAASVVVFAIYGDG